MQRQMVAPAPQIIDWGGDDPGSLVAAAERLRAAAAAALPGGTTSVQLQRTVLECLLGQGLALRPDGRYELRAVHGGQLGEAVLEALEGSVVRPLYRSTPDHSLPNLLAGLQSAGLARIGFVGSVKYAGADPQALLQHAAHPPAPPPAGSGGGSSSAGTVPPHRQAVLVVPRGPAVNAVPVQRPAPVPPSRPLPPSAAGPAPAAAAPLDGELAPVEFDLRDLPLKVENNPSPASIRHAITALTQKKISGNSAGSKLRMYAVGAVLRLGVSKLHGTRCRLQAVQLPDAERFLLQSIQGRLTSGPAMLQHYEQQYHSSLVAVLAEPDCSQLVRQGYVGGVLHFMLSLDGLAPGIATAPATAAAPAAGTAMPLPVPLPVQQPASSAQAAPQAASSSSQGGAAASAVDSVAARLEALRLASGDRLPTPQLVTSEATAAAAVERLLAVPEVAVDCEGELDRAGPISLVQLYAPGAAADGTSGCFVFDLLATPEAERAGAMRHLQRLLESGDVVKVLHDCRSDCEALFYLWGVRCAAVWDTQVAFGVLQLLSSLSGADCDSAPVGLNTLLQQYGLPPNQHKQAMHRRMDREPQLFTARPLEAQVLEYAVADVWQLLPAKACLEADLGPAAALAVDALSRAYSEWCLDPADRSCAGAGAGAGSYAKAVRLPFGQDMQLTIEAPGYRPRYSPALPVADADDAAPAAPAPLPSAVDDPETQCVLQLFPPRVAAAIAEALAAEEAAAAAVAAAVAAGEDDAEGQQAGGGGGTVQLVEVVADHARPLKLRLACGRELSLDLGFSVEDALAHLAAAKGRLHLGSQSGGDLFFDDNRAGVPGTLHRISALRDREGGVLGLTYRVGRHVPGAGALIMDILAALAAWQDAEGHEVQDALSPSLLLLGGPGVGKTTLLRDVSCILADTFKRKVVVVDTSNEVAGDSREPHPCIGNARRMMVPDRVRQHDVMREAVQNQNPEIVVIDEIGSAKEVEACRSIAHRGVVLVGTAHGRSLQALMRNTELNGLIGGLAQVTLGDAAAKESNSGRVASKTRTERRGEPAFATLVEVLGRSRWRVHMSVARSVDALLAGREPVTQLRWMDAAGRMMVRLEGQPEGTRSGRNGSMRAAAGEAADRLGKRGEWMQGLLALAAQYS